MSNDPFLLSSNALMLVTPNTTPLDIRQGRPLSGNRGDFIKNQIKIHTQITRLSIVPLSRLSSQIIHLAKPPCLLLFGNAARQTLTDQHNKTHDKKHQINSKNKYWTTRFVTHQAEMQFEFSAPVVCTIEVEQTQKTTKMLEFFEDLETVRRVLVMQQHKQALELLPQQVTTASSSFVRFAKILKLFNEEKLHTNHYLGALNS